MFNKSIDENQKEVDIAPIGLVASPLQYKQIDVSVPKMFEPYILIVPWPKEESRLFASIRPFQPMVWFWLGVALLVLTPVLAFLSGFYTRYIASAGHPSDFIGRRRLLNFASILHNGSFLLSHITNQGGYYRLY